MSELFFKDGDLTIINADTLKINLIQDGDVDLIVTSPPYNLDMGYNSYADAKPYEEYLDFTRGWLKRCFGWLKPDGRICINVPLNSTKGGQRSIGADVTEIAKEVGLKYQTTIIWNDDHINKNTAWGSWQSASAPYVIARVELIIVLFKETWKKCTGGGCQTFPVTSLLSGRTGYGISTAKPVTSDIRRCFRWNCRKGA